MVAVRGRLGEDRDPWQAVNWDDRYRRVHLNLVRWVPVAACPPPRLPTPITYRWNKPYDPIYPNRFLLNNSGSTV
jgi:hypothetical protein